MKYQKLNLYLVILVYIALVFTAITGFAVDPSPAPSVAAVVASPSPAVPDLLNKIEGLIPNEVSGWVVGIIVFLLGSEGLMRLWPTAKPKSWLSFLSAILAKLASIFGKMSSFLDKFLQNLKDDKK